MASETICDVLREVPRGEENGERERPQDGRDSGEPQPQAEHHDAPEDQRRESGWLQDCPAELRAGDAEVAEERLFLGEHADVEPGQGNSQSSGPMMGAEAEIARLKAELQQMASDKAGLEDVKDLPDAVALTLARTWQPQRNPLSAKWQELAHLGRPLLLELACFEDSALSQEVEGRFGKGSAVRGGLFNGCDLSSPKGVAMAKFLVEKHRPVHVWISCPCGPYCPLQRLNRRDEVQEGVLEEKRSYARKVYKGGIEVAVFAESLGAQVHWELSERSEAWNLSFIQEFLDKSAMQRVVCHGCTVGLRTKDQKHLLCKGWCIATKNQAILKHMHLQCQKNHPKTQCRGRHAEASSRYTPVFVRKIVDCMCEQEIWPRVLQELQTQQTKPGPKPKQHAEKAPQETEEAQANEHEDPPEPPPEDISPEQRARRRDILKKVQHIHWVTGHGDMQSLTPALKSRGVAQEVIYVAKSFQCPVCEERKRPRPRLQATLEVLPRKWERIQTDTGDWEHPVRHHKFRFAMIVDEGSRFRAGKVLSGPPIKKAGSWDDLRGVYEQVWLPAHGTPAAVRVDPAGPWLNENADRYFSVGSDPS